MGEKYLEYPLELFKLIWNLNKMFFRLSRLTLVRVLSLVVQWVLHAR
jgi:hypothetical protein